MAKLQWYEKASVQAASVGGVFLLIATAIGIPSRGPKLSDPPKGTAAIGIPTSVSRPDPSSLTKNLASYDREYSIESVAARNIMRGNLRNLTAAESGLTVQQIPPGTFGFAPSFLFRYKEFEVDRVPIGRLSFELHKPATSAVYAVVFVNADTERRLQLDSSLKEPATIYSDLWKDAPYAVRINASSCRGQGRIITLDDGRNITAVDGVPTSHK